MLLIWVTKVSLIVLSISKSKNPAKKAIAYSIEVFDKPLVFIIYPYGGRISPNYYLIKLLLPNP